MVRFAITCGDINGIGPEITIKSINKIYSPDRRQIIYFCPANIFKSAAKKTKPQFDFQILKKLESISQTQKKVIIFDLGDEVQQIGVPTAEAGSCSYRSILAAFNSVKNKQADVVVTSPVSKTSFELAGIKVPGQTELFANISGSKNYLMMFLSSKMFGGLVTIHEPIKKITSLISKKNIVHSLRIIRDTLKNDLNIDKPHIAVLGLNPHAGEQGRIGKEELNKIIPAINSFDKTEVAGPFVPDAFFATHQYKNYHAVLAMYHDQLLIPFKMMNFNSGVNFTAGLPIIRTSPDHGTGFDIVGKTIADPSSMISAIKWAEKIYRNRSKN